MAKKDASKYRVTFGYGARDGYWYGPNGRIGPYHRGNDRAMPTGTPVKVNSVLIGYSGATGAVSGPHLHTGLYRGSQDKDPSGKEFKVSGAQVIRTGQDSVNGKFVVVKGKDGLTRYYLHLSVIKTRAGTKLKGTNKPKRKEYYRVRAGDNLTIIAHRFRTTVKRLVKLNRIKNPNFIRVNDKLRVK